jgi:uncharacterized protein YjeT (DUF2065 family)
MMTKALAVIFVVAGLVFWLWPSAMGELSARESSIIGGIFLVGAVIVWFIQASDDEAT